MQITDVRVPTKPKAITAIAEKPVAKAAVADDDGADEPVVVAKKSRETSLKGTLDAWG
jgi:hypothetical protein